MHMNTQMLLLDSRCKYVTKYEGGNGSTRVKGNLTDGWGITHQDLVETGTEGNVAWKQ